MDCEQRDTPGVLPDPELWRRLEAFTPDDPEAGLTFTRRLARDMGWPARFAERAVQEYKRFVYLCCAGGLRTVPSEEIDAVWHLHLTYTRSYWDDMCGKVLECSLHHAPTKGGPAQRAFHAKGYEATLDAYRRIFGAEPPSDLWPPADIRFAPATRRVIDTGAFWTIPKQPVRRMLVPAGATALLLALAAGGSTAAMAASGTMQSLTTYMTAPLMIALPLIAALAGLVFSALNSSDASGGWNTPDKDSDSGWSDSSCSGCGGD